jgi:hypothetical protein
MNDDELKKLWQQQPLRNPDPSAAQLVSAMQNKTTQLRRTLLARDVRELAACVFVGVIFGIYYFTQRAPVTRIGALITVAGAIFVACKILYARRKTPAAKPDATVVESLRAELDSVRAQSQLLGSILWWYLLPLALGTLVFVWGMPFGGRAFTFGAIVFKIVFTLGTLALDVFIYRLNQRARSRQLLPVEAQLQSLLHSAQTGEPLDETNVANLRPIVLSMTSSAEVKPVEFKVDFWQLALWGEIGFIGIWFCLFLGLTLNNPDPKTNAQLPKTFAPSVHTEQTNRYSVVARKVIDLFNAGDYAAVQKLYNPDMSQAFPPKETADFYTRLTDQFGNIEKLAGPIGNGYQGWTAFQLYCQRGELTMSLALDSDDQIAGLYFKPASTHFANFKSFVLQLFSWRHLIWLVPFFLGGLSYSWLLQKPTERAVGISALGIHLDKGQNLILWDEITEVRPLRILNIRSLWLIRDSGEETLMRWSGLERHSDLKAAVENSAPPNHPIRKYLSLLRRNKHTLEHSESD